MPLVCEVPLVSVVPWPEVLLMFEVPLVPLMSEVPLVHLVFEVPLVPLVPLVSEVPLAFVSEVLLVPLASGVSGAFGFLGVVPLVSNVALVS